MVAADARTAITCSLSPGEAHDGVEDRKLLKTLPPPQQTLHVIMDRAYEGNEARQLVLDLGFIPVVPPKSNRLEPWEYDREMCKRRKEGERRVSKSSSNCWTSRPTGLEWKSSRADAKSESSGSRWNPEDLLR
jgi:hypothetical protein